jgi:hypothetical protein
MDRLGQGAVKVK